MYHFFSVNTVHFNGGIHTCAALRVAIYAALVKRLLYFY